MSGENKIPASSTEVLKILWQEKFFASGKTLAEITSYLDGKGFHFQAGGLSMALKRAAFLTRSGKRGALKYVQVAPPTSAAGRRSALYDNYDLHPAIQKVSLSQFQDGYFKEAIQNALVEVIDQVKLKAKYPVIKTSNGKKIELDGDDLMNHVFGSENQKPKIKFNALKTSLDKTEQRGFMYLFKGIVGIRDRKAHLNFVQNDPVKTLEFLSFASLLSRLLDENAK
ncbi:MAG: TIGR02391 family protein [Candidatus Sungbacteria bacterium]|nr:TIGR02391 family protein [Candidatus Sungbacteria bacterium]